MLYCNCHYRYKGQLCEVLGFLPSTGEESRKVRIKLQTDHHNKEIICSENDLEEIPLTESILQSCYKSKTYVRDGKWEILWHLGGKNNITIGEKESKFYLIPSVVIETVVELLPRGMVQGQHINGTTESSPLHNVSDLERLDAGYIKLTRNKIRI